MELETILSADPSVSKTSLVPLAHQCVETPADFQVTEGRKFQQGAEIVLAVLPAPPGVVPAILDFQDSVPGDVGVVRHRGPAGIGANLSLRRAGTLCD